MVEATTRAEEDGLFKTGINSFYLFNACPVVCAEASGGRCAMVQVLTALVESNKHTFCICWGSLSDFLPAQGLQPQPQRVLCPGAHAFRIFTVYRRRVQKRGQSEILL